MLTIPAPTWLPKLIPHRDHEGDRDSYIDTLYEKFKADFIHGFPQFNGRPVMINRKPFVEQKEEGFYHVIHGKGIFNPVTLNYTRCERIAWVKAIIEKHPDAEIKSWEREKKGQQRTYLLLDRYPHSQLVILINKPDIYKLLTSYPAFGNEYDDLINEYEKYK